MNETSIFAQLLWPAKMVLRECRSARRTFLILALAIFTGIAVMVFAHSLSLALKRGIDEQAKGLLGADLKLTLRDEFPTVVTSIVQQAGAELSSELRFRSMAAFIPENSIPGSGALPETRLVQVRAIDGGYPFYGTVDTEPPGAWSKIQERGILVDEGLLIQTGAEIGDLLRIGSLTLPISGAVKRFPGESPLSGVVAPRVYLARALLPETLLLQKGSLADYHIFMKFPEDSGVLSFLETARTILENARVETTTVDDQREVLGEVNRNVKVFFELAGIMSLLLGGLASAAALHSYMRKKRLSIGVMKCIGATTRQIRLEVCFHLLLIALQGAGIGGFMGTAAQLICVSIARQDMNLPVTPSVEWSSITLGLLVALGTLMASWGEMARLAKVSPLVVFKSSSADVLRSLSLLSILPWLGAAVWLYLWYSTESVNKASLYGGGIAAILACLTLGAFLLRKGGTYASSQPRFYGAVPYSVRQGIQSLSRPANQTTLLTICFGLTLLLFHTIFISRSFLKSQVDLSQSKNTANVFLFDIQTDQREAIFDLLSRERVSIVEEVPIVLMKISRIKDRVAEEILADKRSTIPPWTLRRDYWSTYRGSTIDNETVVAGEWVSHYSGSGPIPISMEVRLAGNLGVSVGDEILWNVQGVTLTTRIASLRKIMWEQMRRNAFVVFPVGSLEEAPRFLFLTSRTEDAQHTGMLQRKVIQAFPNVSLVDLRAVVERIDHLLGIVMTAVSVLASVIGVTALLALVASMWAGKDARSRETALMRTIGATSSQLRVMTFVEFLSLALLSAVLAIILSLPVGYLLAERVFNAPLVYPILEVGVSSMLFVATIVLLSWFMNRSSLLRPPLEVLRAEGE